MEFLECPKCKIFKAKEEWLENNNINTCGICARPFNAAIGRMSKDRKDKIAQRVAIDKAIDKAEAKKQRKEWEKNEAKKRSEETVSVNRVNRPYVSDYPPSDYSGVGGAELARHDHIGIL